ncbi:DNA topoisomerase 2-binding protein 1 [Nymphaea thermarum]|nr:DNA topoisomerase 2-binding protein 1 [Nymphaea thermarum]
MDGKEKENKDAHLVTTNMVEKKQEKRDIPIKEKTPIKDQEWRKAMFFLSKGPSSTLQFLDDNTKAMLFAYKSQAIDGPCTPLHLSMSPSDHSFMAMQQAWLALGDMPKEQAREEFINLLTSLLPDWRDWFDKNEDLARLDGDGGEVGRIMKRSDDFRAAAGSHRRRTPTEGRSWGMAFEGANVFLSRSLVAPEVFDAVHDALRSNGACVALCCDPSRNSPDDYHVVSSSLHEKFEVLRRNGCTLVGPECVLSCAKERRSLPKQGYTCCFAMDGAKVLASGFDQEEKDKIDMMVTAMSGVLLAKVSLDISFVIVKDVLAAKYKGTCFLFGGMPSARGVHETGKRSTALRLGLGNSLNFPFPIHAPEGDKYKVARKWGSVHIVNPNWVQQSIAVRVCLDESLFPVRGAFSASNNMLQISQKRLSNPEKTCSVSQSATNLENNLSQAMSASLSDANTFARESSDPPALLTREGLQSDPSTFVADDSQNGDDDLYLADCRILLAGFQASEMRELVSMIRKGGGSRYMSFNEKLTHIIVGIPSDVEKKEINRLAMWGVINIVRRNWLEDCRRGKKEVPVTLKHMVSDSLLTKESSSLDGVVGTPGGVPAQNIAQPFSFSSGQHSGDTRVEVQTENSGESRLKRGPFEISKKLSKSVEPGVNPDLENRSLAANRNTKHEIKSKHEPHPNSKDLRAKGVFGGRLFCFSRSYPEDQRAEVIEWVTQSGGLMVEGPGENVDFIIACHGQSRKDSDVYQSTLVSSHWIKFCFEVYLCTFNSGKSRHYFIDAIGDVNLVSYLSSLEGVMREAGSHILFAPLKCRIPLPGFESFWFCVSQYDKKERMLLRNLCYVLGAKFTEKLTAKVTHLICKFTEGPKYEAACNWGIKLVTAEWISDCVEQDTVVSTDLFLPKAVTAQDIEAGICTMSQYPTQAGQLISGEVSSQWRKNDPGMVRRKINGHGFPGGEEQSRELNKRMRGTESSISKDVGLTEIFCCQENVSEVLKTKKNQELGESAPESEGMISDVAAAIEDLLAQSRKMQDTQPGIAAANQTLFSAEQSILSQNKSDSRPTYGMSGQWFNRTENPVAQQNPSDREGNQGHCDGFTETQMESQQVVEYEEDLAGRQMIIERVRTRSMASSSARERPSGEQIDDNLGRLLRVANENK